MALAVAVVFVVVVRHVAPVLSDAQAKRGGAAVKVGRPGAAGGSPARKGRPPQLGLNWAPTTFPTAVRGAVKGRSCGFQVRSCGLSRAQFGGAVVDLKSAVVV